VAETSETASTTEDEFELDLSEEDVFNYECGSSSATSLPTKNTPDTTPPSSPINKRTFSDASFENDEERDGKRSKVDKVEQVVSFQAPVMTYSSDMEDTVDWGFEDDDIC
jgi:hypothetical protein